MGCGIVYCDPAPCDPQAAERIGARQLALDDLLACSDVVTLHVPLLPNTQGMISGRELGRMKPGAILVNAARGRIVDEAALARELDAGGLGGAAVDVYAKEPPDEDNPLIKLEKQLGGRLLLTPHIAGVTRQSWAYLFQSAWQNIERTLIRGKPPENRII